MADVKPTCGGRGTPCPAASYDRAARKADRGGAGFAPFDPEIPLTPPQAAVDEFIRSYKVESKKDPSKIPPWMIPVVAAGTLLLSAVGALYAYRLVKRRRAAAAKETIPPLVAEDIESRDIDVPPPLAPEPEPAPQPEPQPEPAPQPQPEPEPKPEPRPEPAVPPPLPPEPVAQPQPEPKPQSVRSPRPAASPPLHRKRVPVPRGGVFFGEQSETAVIERPKVTPDGDSSHSTTTRWDGTPPDGTDDASRLLDGIDIDLNLDLEWESEEPHQSLGRNTLPAPRPEEHPLAPLPRLERPWQPFAERVDVDSRVEVSALVELAAELGRLSLYSGLSCEDIERRAQSYYDLWMDMPEEKRAELLVGVELEDAFRAGETAIPSSWVLKNEVVLNARLRLAENPIYMRLPDTSRSAFVAEGGLKSVGVDIPPTIELAVAQFDRIFSQRTKMTEIERDGKVETLYEVEHHGPGRHILRSAVAMIGNFQEFTDFVDEVLSRDGLAKLLMVHSDRSSVEKLAFRMGRLIEFSKLGIRHLEMLGKRYLNTWNDLTQPQRQQIIYDDMVERGEVRNEKAMEPQGDNTKAAIEQDRGVPSRPVPVAGGSAFAAKLDEPPNSWLSWQRKELGAWTRATDAASKAEVLTDIDMRTIHRQLYNRRNQDFVGLAASERYIVCKSIASAMEEMRGDAEFMREHVNERGFISPVGIEFLKKLGGAGLKFRVDRSRGLRIIEDRSEREERARGREPKVIDWSKVIDRSRRRGGKSIK